MHYHRRIYLFTIFMLLAFFFYAADSYAQATGQILGQVTAVDGQALSDINIIVHQQIPENPTAWNQVDYATTNANGEYTISALPAGIYRLFFYTVTEQYYSEYYNNAEELGTATDITVGAGATVSGINIALTPAAMIKGVVTDHNGAPLADIRANVMRENQDLVFRSQKTALDGSYEISGLYTGTYQIYFDDPTHATYAPEYYNNVQNREDATLLNITAGQMITGIDAQLDSLSTITGTVTDLSGTPLANITINGDRQRLEQDGLHWDREFSAISGGDGYYTLSGLPAGIYRIRFADTSPIYPWTTTTYATEYYGDLYDPAAATLLTITNSAIVPNINAQLDLRGAVSGRITDAQGRGVSGVVRAAYDNELEPNRGYWVDVLHSAMADNNGNYTFCCLDPVPHRIFFDTQGSFTYISEYYPNAHDAANAMPVPVTADSTTPTIDAQLESYSVISGRVADRQGAGLSNILATLYQASTTNLDEWSVVTSTQPDIMFGQYGFGQLMPGQYRLGFTDLDTPARYADLFYPNATTLETATTISLTYNMTTTADVVLASITSITGTLTDAFGDPLADIWVAALDASNPAAIGTLPVSGGRSDANGHYSLEGLTGGDYIVAFSDGWLPVAVENPNEFMVEYYDNAPDVATATILSVPTGTHRQNVNAQLNPRPRIQGLVTDKQGNSLDGIPVEFQRFVAESQSWQVESTVNTGNGLYRSELLPLGHYRVRFAGNNPTYKAEYYNATYYPDLATTLTMTTGKAYAGINAALAPATFNAQPWAQPDAITVPAGQITATSGKFPSLLANDQDAEGAVLTAHVATLPTHGTLSLNTDGHFTYRHNGDSATHDLFTYRADDGLTQSEPATVTITISPTALELSSFVFSKTVSIEGITPSCTPMNQIKVPLETTIVYCYTVRNTGSITLTTHSLADSHLGQLLNNVTYRLAPGAQYTTTFTQTLTVNTTNVATWTATAAAVQGLLSVPATTTAQERATVIISGPDDDQDGDTIPDNLERADDLDGDNIPNFLDTDADGDGWLDQVEVGTDPRHPADSNNDGIPDYLDRETQSSAVRSLYLPVIHK